MMNACLSYQLCLLCTSNDDGPLLDIPIDIVHDGQETTDDNRTDQTRFVRRGVIERERDN